jgi:hypothetical protein
VIGSTTLLVRVSTVTDAPRVPATPKAPLWALRKSVLVPMTTPTWWPAGNV